MLGRPTPLWILGLLGMIGGLLCAIVVLQFAVAIPWAGDEATYIGGNWTGVLTYAFAGGMMFAAGYGWLTVKPWASMITILAALVGFFVPFISHMDGTDPRSSAVTPLIVSVLMLFMVFRPSTNRAMAEALAGQGTTAVKAPPPPKPMSAARKREVAEEQKRAAKKQAAAAPKAAPAPAKTAPSAGTTAIATATAAASATVSQAVSAMPKPASGAIPKPAQMASAAPVRPAVAGLAKTAASMLGRAPAASSAKPAATAAPKPSQPAAAAPSPTVPANQRPGGFRADDV